MISEQLPHVLVDKVCAIPHVAIGTWLLLHLGIFLPVGKIRVAVAAAVAAQATSSPACTR